MCGIFGVFGHDRAAELTFFGLHSLQHRGQESAGICVSDGTQIMTRRGTGLVSEVFAKEEYLNFEGRKAIGHVRYTTAGDSGLVNAQPLVFRYTGGQVSIAHNGNLVNAPSLRQELERQGSIFQTTSDSEVIVHLLASNERSIEEGGLAEVLERVEGAYSLLLSTRDRIFAVRDPAGIRPLWLGEIGETHVLASETCAFDLVGARAVREIEPGEILTIEAPGPQGLSSQRLQTAHTPAACIFEHIYFARPDSHIFGECVHEVRKQLGRILAREKPVEADVVIAVPDSGKSAALGFSLESNIPMDYGFIRNHYVGRTFIQPAQGLRDMGVRVKLNVVREVVANRRVVVVDDSIVRGTTSRQRIDHLRKAGALEVHLRISCPPIRYPCYYGIDFPDPGELIANQFSVEEMVEFLGIDSLGYLSQEGMLSAVSSPGEYCRACFSGHYPVRIHDTLWKESLEHI